MSALINSNDRSAYVPYANGSRGNGYDPASAINGQIAGRGMYETTNPSMNFEDKWAKWFGQPPYGYFEPDNYSMLGHENYQLPTAYIGRNLHIEKMLNVAIASEDDFYTRVLLPWKVYDGMKITYSRWSGFDHMMYQVPEEVPAPQIMTKFESGEAYQQRYGLAFKMEHGFQRTEMGQQAYAANLAIISQAVLRTVYARIMQVLVSQRNMLAVFAQRQHNNALIQAREVSKLAVHSFGTLQKNTYGMDHVIGQIEKLFNAKMLAQPDAVILPQGCLQYLKTCKPEERVFALCGELSRRLELDPQRSVSLNVYKNNYQIFEHRPLTVSDDPSNVNMLVRDREVGNVFRLFRNTVEEFDNYAAPTAIKVIDHDKQRWAMITLEEALRNTGVWSGMQNDVRNGDLSDRHLQNSDSDSHPLKTETGIPCQVIGDLPFADRFSTRGGKLKKSTIISAVRSIERFLNIGTSDMTDDMKGRVQKLLKSLCSNNVWDRNISSIWADSRQDGNANFMFGNSNIGSSAATASVDEVAGALQSALLETVVVDPTEEMTAKASSETIMSAIADVVSVTSDMTEVQRGSIASAFVGAVSGFKTSKSALKKVLRNTDESKQPELDAAFGEAIRKDFKTNWKTINSEAKKIAANIGPQPGGRVTDGDSIVNDKVFEERCKAINDLGLGTMQRALARWYLGCSIDLPTIVSLDAQGIVTPFGAYVFRPFQNFSMGSAIVMRSGTDTGFTAVGNSDFTLGDNATNKTHLGHFTFYFEPVVTENNHVMIARDVAFMGYNGGCGVEFFESWKEALSGTRRDHAPSLLAALAFQHESEEEYRMDPISINGKFHDSSILHNLNKDRRMHYETADFYSEMIGQPGGIDATTADAGDDGYYNQEYMNFICYQGLQVARGPDKTFSQHTTNTGHLGDSETTDSSLAWSGMLAMKTSVNYHHAQNSVSILGKST